MSLQNARFLAAVPLARMASMGIQASEGCRSRAQPSMAIQQWCVISISS